MRTERQAGGSPLAVLLVAGLLVGCSGKEAPDDQTRVVHAPELARIVPAAAAIRGAHVPTLDPMTMVEAEIVKVLGPGPHCEFRYTSEGKPVLAAKSAQSDGAPDAVVKLNGHLVALRRSAAEGGGFMLVADGIRMTVTPDDGEPLEPPRQQEANAVFQIGDRLRVGYRGYYRCVESPAGSR